MLRETALHMFDAALRAADPAAAVARQLPQQLPQPDPGGRLGIIALGKAARAMMVAALEHVPSGTAWEGLIVTNEGNAAPLEGCTCIIGGHPVPNEGSAAAGAAMLRLAEGLGPKDRLLALISGGGSALAVAPRASVTLDDKMQTTQALLASGLDITAMNRIRQRLSALKGGGLARAAHPAPVTALILSDVIGDDLSAVASGPTVPPPLMDALDLPAALLQHLPRSARKLLEAAPHEGPAPSARNLLMGSNTQAMRAAADARPGTRLLDEPVIGDVAPAAARLIGETHESFVAGGETTVVIKGNGKGGRNQELALRFALLAETQLTGEWLFLSAGTDGRDGPTDAAGAIITPDTLAKIRAAGVNPEASLANNDAYHALDAGGALLRIPSTGTNVADIQIFLRPKG